MTQDNPQKLKLGMSKRLSKYLGISQRKAQRLLHKYRRSSISWENPPTQKEWEEQLFKIIEEGENLEN